jgi:hypothetical protein
MATLTPNGPRMTKDELLTELNSLRFQHSDRAGQLLAALCAYIGDPQISRAVEAAQAPAGTSASVSSLILP